MSHEKKLMIELLESIREEMTATRGMVDRFRDTIEKTNDMLAFSLEHLRQVLEEIKRQD